METTVAFKQIKFITALNHEHNYKLNFNLFLFDEALNMAMAQNFEVMLRQILNHYVGFCNLV
jgi:hypothetical protein